MTIMRAILRDFLSFFSLKTKRGVISLIVLLSFIILALVVFSNEEAPIPEKKQVPAVSVAKVSTFTEGTSLNLIGTVSATDRVIIQSEKAGRVTNVGVKLGEFVSAGTIVASLENASEYASLLQAEGGYEAAQASAQSGDNTVESANIAFSSAKNDAIVAYSSAYTSASSIVYTTLDVFYSNPRFKTPGVKIETGKVSFLNSERAMFNDMLSQWQSATVTISPTSDLNNELLLALKNLRRVLVVTDIYISAVESSRTTDLLNGKPVSTFASTLTGARSALANSISTVEKTRLALENAEKNLEKTSIGGTSGVVSIANAQIKQALGVLKAAQAQYSKTLLRTPIAGVVNSIDIQTGDFVSSFQVVGEIANNKALEITTYVGESDRQLIELQLAVLIEGSETGIISAIAPVVNQATGKIEVKIQTTSQALINGDTVTITLPNVATEKTNVLRVPITAIKFTSNAGAVFTIENGILVSHTVELGKIRDSYIEISSGISPEMLIVKDVRGFNESQLVTSVSE